MLTRVHRLFSAAIHICVMFIYGTRERAGSGTGEGVSLSVCLTTFKKLYMRGDTTIKKGKKKLSRLFIIFDDV